jgi:hypothetical protein
MPALVCGTMRKWQKIPTVKDRRRHGRAAVLLRAKIASAKGEVRGFVRNLSQTGAMMDAHHGLAADMMVTLACAEMEIPARVAWTEQRRLGLEFSKPLDETAVATMVASRKPELASA